MKIIQAYTTFQLHNSPVVSSKSFTDTHTHITHCIPRDTHKKIGSTRAYICIHLLQQNRVGVEKKSCQLRRVIPRARNCRVEYYKAAAICANIYIPILYTLRAAAPGRISLLFLRAKRERERKSRAIRVYTLSRATQVQAAGIKNNNRSRPERG